MEYKDYQIEILRGGSGGFYAQAIKDGTTWDKMFAPNFLIAKPKPATRKNCERAIKWKIDNVNHTPLSVLVAKNGIT